MAWSLSRPVGSVLVLGGVVRVVVALVSFLRNPVYLIPDETQYVAIATKVAQGEGAEAWFPGYGQALYESTWVYTAPIAFLFRVFEPTRLLAQLYAASFGVLTAVLTLLLARRLVSPRLALAAAALVALLPSQLLWSSVALRESLIWAGLAGLALTVTASVGSRRVHLPAAIVTAALLLLWLGHLRTQTMVVAAWALLFSALVVPGRDRVLRGLGVGAVAVLVPVALGVGPLGWTLVSSSATTLGRARTALGIEADSSTTSPITVADPSSVECPTAAELGPRSGTPTTQPGAMAISGADLESVDDGRGGRSEVICSNTGEVLVIESGLSADLRHLPTGAAAAVLRPYPWEGGDNAQAVGASVENIAWYALYVLAAVGAVASRRRLDVVAFPVFLVGGIVVTGALTHGNVGTAFRHRAQILWALALLGAAGAAWIARRRANAE